MLLLHLPSKTSGMFRKIYNSKKTNWIERLFDDADTFIFVIKLLARDLSRLRQCQNDDRRLSMRILSIEMEKNNSNIQLQ